METGEDKVKLKNNWRPRFSIRTLAIFVTLVGVYFGAWGPTKRHAASQVNHQSFLSGQEAIAIWEARSPFPLIIVQDECVTYHLENPQTQKLARRFYLWLFGPRFRLPFEFAWSPGPPLEDDPFGLPVLPP